MKWPSRYALRDREGETRVVRKFLLWPRTFNSTHTRWLVYANIIEVIQRIDIGGSGEWGSYKWSWCETGFDDAPTTLSQGSWFV